MRFCLYTSLRTNSEPSEEIPTTILSHHLQAVVINESVQHWFHESHHLSVMNTHERILPSHVMFVLVYPEIPANDVREVRE